jgi:hypothetical protein
MIINGIVFFLFILLMAVVIAVIYGVRNRNKPTPAYVSKPKSFTQNQFQEEFGIEKETKVIKEKVDTETSTAKIEKVAAAKFHEEIGEELSPLKRQLNAIQSALNHLESREQENMSLSVGENYQQPNQILQQLQDFSSQAQQQTHQQLQQTIQQTAQMLGNAEHSLQSINTLDQITQQMYQLQQQQEQSQQEQSSQQSINKQS